jgi:BirA family transcriptional regulator, biotin operon repressor / biotin---[acetyl-CoA-carboxylase] ligase
MLLAALRGRYLRLGLTNGAADIRAELVENCLTIGQQVRAELPDGSEILGTAAGIDPHGRLLLAHSDGTKTTALSAADVWHLRN